MNNYEKTSFKKLLEKLQEDSWQLELLISGFAIFGLFYSLEPVHHASIEALRGEETISFITLNAVKLFLLIMIFNLMLHIILRALWIGALGLRYVSGEINFDNLNYSEKFTNYLKRKVGSFDSYIGKLENYCSVIFGISFLLVFYVLALVIFLGILLVIKFYFFNNGDLLKWIGLTVLTFLILGALLTFFDLVTTGLLKKKQWTAKIYFPFYLIFSILTLSFLYRPLVYNFLDNKLGKRISLFLIPFYFLIILITSFHYQQSNFFTKQNNSNSIIANHNNYEDLKDKDAVFNDFTIQSKVISDPYLKIYMPFYTTMEDVIFKFNPDLKPEKDERGLQFGLVSLSKSITKEQKQKKDSLRSVYIKTFNTIFTLKIDSTAYKSAFIIDKIKKEKFGFEMYLVIKKLKEGKHMLIMSEQLKKDSVGSKILTKIPFWYFPK